MGIIWTITDLSANYALQDARSALIIQYALNAILSYLFLTTHVHNVIQIAVIVV